MQKLDIAIIKSSFENLEKLNNRIYFEAERKGYHNLTTENFDGVQNSIYIFNGLKNKQFIQTILEGYEYLNESNIYFGKVEKLEKYEAKEYTGKPIRIRVSIDNGEVYDVPLEASNHLQIIL